jgi:plastocyanin
VAQPDYLRPPRSLAAIEKGSPVTRVLVVLSLCAGLALAQGCGSGGSRPAGSVAAKRPASTTQTVKSGLVPDGKINYASPSANAQVRSGLVKITYREFTIEPDTVRAKVGSTLKWTNEDTEKCNVTSEGGAYKFASKDLGESASFELKLDKPGIIHYECTYYPSTMNGAIEVVS